MKLSISLCMIVKNEAETLSKCLSSVIKIVDEIIIVDTGSTDNTKEIASRYTDKIYDFEWVNDFSKARNYAFSLATKDYVMWLDADDVLLPLDAEILLEEISNLPQGIDYMSMEYYLSKDTEGNVLLSTIRNRIVKNQPQFIWIGKIHEYLAVSGNGVISKAVVTHERVHENSDRNLKIYEIMDRQNENFTARDLYYYGNELFDHMKWEKAIKKYQQYIDSKEGWVEDTIRAYLRIAECNEKLGNVKAAKENLLATLFLTAPRPEICCRLGNLHMYEQDYKGAIVWYLQATNIPKFITYAGFVYKGYDSWIPHLNLCVCYYKLGMYKEAYEHNEEAARYNAKHPSVIYNRKYFLENKNKLGRG